jgi:malonate transporter and related proteins
MFLTAAGASTVILALLPIVLLIALGAFIQRRKILEDIFWPQAERLSYYVLLPALFFYGLVSADTKNLPVLTLSIVLILATLCAAASLILVKPLLRIDGPAFTSIFQGAIRFNNYVGVTVAAGLLGVQGIALAAICNAAIVPTVNILCVLAFARYGSAKFSGRAIMWQVISNPLVVASLSGIAYRLLGLGFPPGVGETLAILGSASLPIGLICIGAALNFSAVRQWITPIMMSSVFKFGMMPIATLVLASTFGLQGPALTVALLFQSLPTASSAYIMARQLGGDAHLMAGITAAQTILAIPLIPFIILALANIMP